MTAEHAAESDARSYPPGEHPNLPAPPGTTGAVGWARKNLFSSIPNAILALGALYLTWLLLAWGWSWIVADSVISGDDQTICRLSGSIEEFDSNTAKVDWSLLNAAGAPAGAVAGNDGFDKLGAYGRQNGGFRWVIDTDNDGGADGGGFDPARGAGAGGSAPPGWGSGRGPRGGPASPRR